MDCASLFHSGVVLAEKWDTRLNIFYFKIKWSQTFASDNEIELNSLMPLTFLVKDINLKELRIRMGAAILISMKTQEVNSRGQEYIL